MQGGRPWSKQALRQAGKDALEQAARRLGGGWLGLTLRSWSRGVSESNVGIESGIEAHFMSLVCAMVAALPVSVSVALRV